MAGEGIPTRMGLMPRHTATRSQRHSKGSRQEISEAWLILLLLATEGGYGEAMVVVVTVPELEER